jgi:hypothetical protein
VAVLVTASEPLSASVALPGPVPTPLIGELTALISPALRSNSWHPTPTSALAVATVFADTMIAGFCWRFQKPPCPL